MDLKSRLNEIKPHDLNCNIFDVYNYNGLSMQELLCQFFTKINECVEVSNNTIDITQWLVNEGLKQEVVEKLNTWLNDGTLEELINIDLLNNLNNKINLLENRINSNKYLFFGDSYAEGYTPDGNVTSWCTQVKNLLHLSDENYYSYYKGGYGFTNGGFQSLLEKSINEIQDKENIKYIVVGGGYNDATSYENINVGMETFMDLCKSSYPNAKILVAPFGWCVEGLTTGVHKDQRTLNLINMVLEYQRNAVINGVGYIDSIYSALHKTDFFCSDYVHPNSNGQYNIALCIANYLKTGAFSTVEYMRTENCFTNNVYEDGISSTLSCFVTVDGKNTILNLSPGTIKGDFNNITLNGNSILLGTIKSACLNGCYNKTIFNCYGVLKVKNEYRYIPINYALNISNNKLYMSISLINSEGNNFETLSFEEIRNYYYTTPVTINSLIH